MGHRVDPTDPIVWEKLRTDKFRHPEILVTAPSSAKGFSALKQSDLYYKVREFVHGDFNKDTLCPHPSDSILAAADAVRTGKRLIYTTKKAEKRQKN